jgi:hypothetical protein
MIIERTITGEEPITLVEAKQWARIDYEADDAIVRDLIKSVRDYVEQYLGRSLVSSTITYQLDPDYVSDMVSLPLPYHGQIVSVKLDGVETDTYSVRGIKRLTFEGFEVGTYEITYTTIGDCPAAVKTVMRRLLADQNETRNGDMAMTVDAMRMLMPYSL